MTSENRAIELLSYASDIVSSYLGQNHIHHAELPTLIRSVYETLDSVSAISPVVQPADLRPAVSIKKSITDECIICLEDGVQLKMLKRYLRTHYNLTPDQYRSKWGLPSNYPMVAPNYASARSEMAKQLGLGKKAPASGRGRKKLSK